MSQAEIAGGAATPPNELPSKGRILPDFALPAASSGSQVHLSDFRSRANLVVIADDGLSETANLISEVGRQHGDAPKCLRSSRYDNFAILFVVIFDDRNHGRRRPLC